MQFTVPSVANRMPSISPLLGVALLPALLVLATVCFSLSREEQFVRLPTRACPGLRSSAKRLRLRCDYRGKAP